MPLSGIQRWAGVVALFSLWAAAVAAPPVTRETAVIVGGARAPELAVEVLGGSRPMEMVLSRWVRTSVASCEAFAGYPISRERYLLRIRVSDTSSGVGRVGVNQGVVRQRHVQQLFMENCALISADSALEVLCRALLARYAFQDSEASGSNSGGAPAGGIPGRIHALPGWWVRGVVRNLDPAWRAEDSDAVLKFLSDSTLPTVQSILAEAASGALVAADGIALHRGNPAESVLVRWLVATVPVALPFRELSAAVSRGSVTPESLCGLLPGCTSAADVEAQWGVWAEGESLRIHNPGTVRAADLDRLKAALLLIPGESGIPLTNGPAGGALGDLREWRRSPWLPSAVAARTLQLRTLALGRSEAFAKVVACYCDYLASLGTRESTENIEKRWLEAEDSRRTLVGTLASEALNDGRQSAGE